MERILRHEFHGTVLQNETNPVLADGDAFYAIRPPQTLKGKMLWLIEKFSWKGPICQYLLVQSSTGILHCNCPHGTHRSGDCRHVKMIQDYGLETLEAATPQLRLF